MHRSFRMAFLNSFCILMVTSSFAVAQKDGSQEDYGIFANQQEYYQFMGDVKQSVRTNPEMKGLIPFINDVALGRPIGWTSQKYGGNENGMGMLANDKIRADLEMDDDQFKEMQKLTKDIQSRAAEQLRNIDFSDTKSLAERIRKIRDESQDAMRSVLLPHQRKRLGQLRRQTELRYRTLAELLTSDPIREELELSEKQSEALLDSEKEILADLEKKIAKLREEARKDLLKNLDRGQREKVDDLLGDILEVETNEPRKKRTPKGSEKFKK